MLLKKLKPKSPGTRHQIIIDKKILAKTNKILKNHNIGKKFRAGRSSQTGHITSWHRGGHLKQKLINLKIDKKNAIHLNLLNLHNPNRNNFVSLKYNFLQKKFEVCPTTNSTCSGMLTENGEKTETLKNGCFLPLEKIPVGAQVHSITNKNTTKVLYARAPGTSTQILQKSKNFIKLKMPSGEIITTTTKLYGYIGSNSNPIYNLKVLGKAGKSRFFGKRSIVRGVAMNPVDHPHGGQTSGGRPSVSPWGKLTKGVPTKKKSK